MDFCKGKNISQNYVKWPNTSTSSHCRYLIKQYKLTKWRNTKLIFQFVNRTIGVTHNICIRPPTSPYKQFYRQAYILPTLVPKSPQKDMHRLCTTTQFSSFSETKKKPFSFILLLFFDYYLKMFHKVCLFKGHKLAAFTLECFICVGGDMFLILVLVIGLKIAFTALQLLQTDVSGAQPWNTDSKLEAGSLHICTCMQR